MITNRDKTTFFLKGYVNKNQIFESRPIETSMQVLGHQICNLAIKLQVDFDENKNIIFSCLSKDELKNSRPSITMELYTNNQVLMYCTKDGIKLKNLAIEMALICEKMQAGVEDLVFDWGKEEKRQITSGKTLKTDRYQAEGRSIPDGGDFRSLDDE